MKSLLLATALFVAVAPAYAKDQPPPPTQPLQADQPVKTELDGVFKQLADQVKEADTLLGLLKTTQALTPEQLTKQVQQSSQALASLIDRLQEKGDVAGRLMSVRAAAAQHLKRVTELPKGSIDEEDRTNLITAWNGILQGADQGKANLETIRESLGGALTRLRMRSTAIGEMMLAAQYQQAIDAFNHWIGELKNTVDDLHRVIGTPAS